MVEASGRVAPAPPGLETVFRDERGHLFGVLYRLTGSTADAEDLVQSTFERALERPPADTARPWRPWLVRVAVNLGRDHLRRRRRRDYDGPWLPAPLETPDGELPFGVPEPVSTQGRYELMESVSYAFLLALERLTPTQRAVLLLRDVFEYDGRETAELLGLSEAGARQHLRRARRAMDDYDSTRQQRARHGPLALGQEAVQQILARFLAAIAAGDPKQVEELLAEDVVLETDAGGEYHAARIPVVGRNKVARFYVNISRLSGPPRPSIRLLNGEPAVVLDIIDPKPGISPRVATMATLDEAGRLKRIYSVLATRKLDGIAPAEAGG